MKEQLWDRSSNCSGPPTRVAWLPEKAASCPGPEHYNPNELDLERFVAKVQRDHGNHVQDEATARAAVEEYRKMLILIQRFPEQPVVPSKLVDLVWHEHILDTKRYKRDCLRMFGQYIHHSPSFGGEDEKSELSAQQKEMFQLYQTAFDGAPPVSVWPTARTKPLGGSVNGQHLPDCCSALCVKPSCHDCVGCNSVDCGKLGGEEGASHASQQVAKRMLSPESFSGYVPARKPMLTSPEKSNPYACSVSPLSGMSLQWTISGKYIHFNHTLLENSAWYSVGLSGKAPFDMGFADYMLSMYTRNYSGVKDLYKFDAGQGYPCFDVLMQCSHDNFTAGTKDVENESIERVAGRTSSVWRRKLVTPDYKDEPIVASNMSVLFAHGNEDSFTYHGRNFATCQVNFHSGLVDCGAKAKKGYIQV